MSNKSRRKEASYDVIVVGGGMTGICAAIASARQGVKTALVHDRPVLGGNASSEIRMHICGASTNMTKEDLEETGILYEIMLENKNRNDYYNYSIWDSVLFWAVKNQPNLTTYLNTVMHDAEYKDDTIYSILCYQNTTEVNWKFDGKIFVDCTGNGTLGFLSGAEFRTGSEGKDEFSEPHAPDKPNDNRMGNSLLFKAIDRGVPVRFKTPEWAYCFSEEQLKYRKHGNVNPIFGISNIDSKISFKDADSQKYFDAYCIDYGYWWIELPGHSDDIIEEYEEIRDELVKCIYGIWDHIKNGGDHQAENYDLLWVGMLPGVRESRRFVGDYMLTENDILSNRIFEDAVAYGGWPLDNHVPKGLFDFDKLPTFLYNFPGIYTIPYRSYYSKNISNLFLGGRIISASKLAMSSSRVMATCAVGGQAVGTAAGMCIRYGCGPKGILKHINELQQQLIKDDCYIPGHKNEDEKDLARKASIMATSECVGRECTNVVNGMTRKVGEKFNYWESDGICEGGEVLTLALEKSAEVKQVRLIFDSNLSRPVKITLSSKRMKQEQTGVPAELVADYDVVLWRGKTPVYTKKIRGNYQRINVLDFPSTLCDRITVNVFSTNGIENVRIFEVRVYA